MARVGLLLLPSTRLKLHCFGLIGLCLSSSSETCFHNSAGRACTIYVPLWKIVTPSSQCMVKILWWILCKSEWIHFTIRINEVNQLHQVSALCWIRTKTNIQWFNAARDWKLFIILLVTHSACLWATISMVKCCCWKIVSSERCDLGLNFWIGLDLVSIVMATQTIEWCQWTCIFMTIQPVCMLLHPIHLTTLFKLNCCSLIANPVAVYSTFRWAFKTVAWD